MVMKGMPILVGSVFLSSTSNIEIFTDVILTATKSKAECCMLHYLCSDK